jgi:hypothetical protein
MRGVGELPFTAFLLSAALRLEGRWLACEVERSNSRRWKVKRSCWTVDTRLVSRARRSQAFFYPWVYQSSGPLLSFCLLVAAARMIEIFTHFFFGHISGFSAPLTKFPPIFRTKRHYFNWSLWDTPRRFQTLSILRGAEAALVFGVGSTA